MSLLRWRRGRLWMFWPRTCTVPEVGSSTPMSTFSRVLFAQPDPPRTVKTSPAKTSRLTPLSTLAPLNAFTKSRTTSKGSAGFDGGVGRFISERVIGLWRFSVFRSGGESSLVSFHSKLSKCVCQLLTCSSTPPQSKHPAYPLRASSPPDFQGGRHPRYRYP